MQQFRANRLQKSVGDRTITSVGGKPKEKILEGVLESGKRKTRKKDIRKVDIAGGVKKKPTRGGRNNKLKP